MGVLKYKIDTADARQGLSKEGGGEKAAVYKTMIIFEAHTVLI